MKHIKNQLPNLYQEITSNLEKKQEELKIYGSSYGENLEEQQTFIFKLIWKN
jgi:hypothetical protein